MSTRMERANSEIQKALQEIVTSKMNDPRLNKIVSITDVSTSPDFRSCKVSVSVLDIGEIAGVTKVLQKSEGFIKRELAHMVSMPQVPKLHFVVDKSAANEMRVEELLRSLNIPKESEDDQD